MSDFYTHVYSNRRGIHYRGYANGQRITQLITNYQPSLFTVAESGATDAHYKTIDDIPLRRIKFDSIDDAQAFRRASPEESKHIFGNNRYHFAFISDTFEEGIEFDNNLIRKGTIDIETDSSTGFPSAQMADKAIITITISFRGIYYVFALKPLSKPPAPNVKFKHFKTEKEMLSTFLEFWQRLDLDIIFGWNTDQYDIPFIINRFKNVFGERGANGLSPWGLLREIKVNFKGKQIDTYEIVGITSLDYIDLYRRYMPKSESDALKFVAEAELGETKLEYDGTINEFYENDFDRFVDYNVQDVALVEKLDKKLRLADMIIATAFDARCNFSDVQQQVRMWDAISLNMLKKRKIAVPSIKEEHKDTQFAGAYVLRPQVGKHKWVISFDFESLYPSLIIEHNISPDTILGSFNQVVDLYPEYTEMEDGYSIVSFDTDLSPLQDSSLTGSSAGFCFDRSKQGFLPEILSTMFQDRLKYKNLKKEFSKKAELEKDPAKKKEYRLKADQYEILQLAKKVQLNAAYGALGSKYFRFFDLELATSVTLSGRAVLLRTKKTITEKMQEKFNCTSDPIIYGDTDSLYISAKSFVDTLPLTLSSAEIVEQVNTIFCPMIAEYAHEAIKEHRQQYNTLTKQINMVRDVIAEDTIFVSKKCYLMEIWDKEGTRYTTPERKAVGLAMIKSTTSKFCKVWLSQAVDCILKKSEKDLHILIDDFRHQFENMPLDKIGYPQNVNLLEKYIASLSLLPEIKFENTIEEYTDSRTLLKGAPIGVAAAFTYNRFLKEKNLDKKYQSIKSGDRTRYIHLKHPNVFRSHVIGLLDKPPKEMNLKTWIDYDTQFDKVFQKPLNILLDAVGWHKAGGLPNIMSIFD